MEHWSKTSCYEPFPLVRRKDKRKLDFGNSSSNNKVAKIVPIVHGHQEYKALGYGDGRTALMSKRAHESQSFTKSDRSLQVTDKKSLGNSPQRSENEQQKDVDARNKVMDILHKFREHCERLSDMKCSNLNRKKNSYKRVEFEVTKMVEKELGHCRKKKFLGSIPGIKIGDKFFNRMELHVLGLHLLPESGIDTMDYRGEKIATSIVSWGGYNNDLKDPNILIYCGQGGYDRDSGEQVKDKKCMGVNQALLNSKTTKNPVRVMKGRKELKGCNRNSMTYTYDGLYTVEDVKIDKDPMHNKRFFKFTLVKIPGQS